MPSCIGYYCLVVKTDAPGVVCGLAAGCGFGAGSGFGATSGLAAGVGLGAGVGFSAAGEGAASNLRGRMFVNG
jgi:hypothetical protein